MRYYEDRKLQKDAFIWLFGYEVHSPVLVQASNILLILQATEDELGNSTGVSAAWILLRGLRERKNKTPCVLCI